MSDARSARRTPGGRRGAARDRRRAGRQGAADGAAVRTRPRLTARAAVLLLVLAALMASYASSLRAYVDQRRHVASLSSQIEDSRSAITDLEREKRRWGDDAYVIAQARARFAFALPGEIGYQVLDEDGRPLHHEDTLSQPEPVVEDDPEWWERTADSIGVAADPPRPQDDEPVEKITTPPDLRTPPE